MSGDEVVNGHYISPDAVIRGLDLASSYLASGAEPFDAFPLEYWVREWLPDFLIEVVDQ